MNTKNGTGIEELWKQTTKKIRMDQVHTDVNHKAPAAGDLCQVVLYNDDHHTSSHVVKSLIAIFQHSEAIAEKIMLDAHNSGRSVAEVEDYEKAVEHAKQLLEAGLKSEVESF
jgi:ATP-dependent Clp protease adapter protein ClpS